MPQSSHGPPTMLDFLSSSGQGLVRQLLRSKVPFDLHDYQIEGTCAVLHGQDLLGCIPTGGGKTAFLFLPILFIHALHQDTSIIPHVKKRFPRNPVMIAVFPTNSLELEKEKEFEAVGVKALAINTQKLDEARKNGRSLWHEARNDVSVVLLSPEQLVSRAFDDLIQDPAFSARIFFIGVDEIQLLDIWGANFRKAFQQIGFIRARLPERIVLIALTATLLAGERHANICRFLGLKTGQYRLIRRSNQRPDIQLLVRELTTGLGGWQFPDLDWVLEKRHKTIIFCKTILLGFRVMVYLWLRAPPSPNRSTRIRSYNSLNSVAYNTRTQELMLSPGSGLEIIIATDTLSQGVNAPDIRDVITMGQPTDPDEFFQRVGRAGRDRTAVSDARGIMYVPVSARKTARAVLKLADGNQSSRQKKPPEMHVGVAHLLVAPCLREAQDQLYDNPLSDPPCTCASCTSRPPPSRTITCNCSSCIPDPGDNRARFITMNPFSMSIAQPQRLPPNDVKIARGRLVEFRWQMWKRADEIEAAFEPPELYLPDDTITAILEYFTALKSPDDLDTYCDQNPYVLSTRNHLWTTICNIREELARSQVTTADDLLHDQTQPESIDHQVDTSGMSSADSPIRVFDAVSTAQPYEAVTSAPTVELPVTRQPSTIHRQGHSALPTQLPTVAVHIPKRPSAESNQSGIRIRIRRPQIMNMTQTPLSPSKRRRNNTMQASEAPDIDSGHMAKRRKGSTNSKENRKQ